MTPIRQTVAAATAVLLAMALAASGSDEWASVAILVGVAVAVVLVDRRRRIPTGSVALSSAAVMAFAAMVALRVDPDRVALCLGGAAIVGGAFSAVHLHPRDVGFDQRTPGSREPASAVAWRRLRSPLQVPGRLPSWSPSPYVSDLCLSRCFCSSRWSLSS
jgi:hypothetical protein